MYASVLTSSPPPPTYILSSSFVDGCCLLGGLSSDQTEFNLLPYQVQSAFSVHFFVVSQKNSWEAI